MAAAAAHFTVVHACSVRTNCIAQFNIHDVSTGEPAKLFTVPALSEASGRWLVEPSEAEAFLIEAGLLIKFLFFMRLATRVRIFTSPPPFRISKRQPHSKKHDDEKTPGGRPSESERANSIYNDLSRTIIGKEAPNRPKS
jgi:hypothetical protein